MNKAHNATKTFGFLALAAGLLSTGCATTKIEVDGSGMTAPSGRVTALKGDGREVFQLERGGRSASRCKDVYAFTFGERVAGDAVTALAKKLDDTSLSAELIAPQGEPFACAKPAPLMTVLTVATGVYLFTGPTKVIELKYKLRVKRYGKVLLESDVDYSERETHNIITGHADGIYERAGKALAEESLRQIKVAGLL